MTKVNVTGIFDMDDPKTRAAFKKAFDEGRKRFKETATDEQIALKATLPRLGECGCDDCQKPIVVPWERWHLVTTGNFPDCDNREDEIPLDDMNKPW